MPRAIDIVFEKVWCDLGTVWRKDRTPRISYTSNALKPGRELDALRFVAGDTAIGFPEEQENAWLCVCGRPNRPGSELCARCRRTREVVFGCCTR